MAFCVPGPWAPDCISDGIKNVVGGVIGDFIKSLYEGAIAMVAQVSTFWMDTATPDVSNGAVTELRADMSWYVAGFAVLGFFLGLIKLVTSQDVKNSLIGLATPIVNLILATAVYATGIGLLLTASDEFSRWIVERATGGDVDLTQMVTTASGLLANPGPAFLMFVLLLLGAIVNLIFMYFRDVMFLILSSFIVLLAAASGSEQGRQAWRKANGWLVALLLFKPVAAGIYSLGFRMLVDGNGAEEGDASLAEALNASIIALLILILASLALPALIKFIVPAAGVGAGAFSGGAALGAGITLAAGAAVLAGTGGAAAAGGAGSMGGGAAAGGGAASMGGGASMGGAAGNGAAASSSSSAAPGSGGSVGGGEAPSTGTGSSSGAEGGSGASESISGTDAGSSASGSDASGGSGASETISGSDGGTTSSGSTSDSESSGDSSSSGASGASSTGSGSGSAPSPGATPSSSTDTASNNDSSGTSEAGQENSSSPSGAQQPSTGQAQPGQSSTSGSTGAKPASTAAQAMQKMGNTQGLAQGANPSKFVDEDGE